MDKLRNLEYKLRKTLGINYLKIGIIFVFVMPFSFIFFPIVPDSGILVLIAASFASFVIGFILLILHIFLSEKKERLYLEILNEELWSKILLEKSFNSKYDYSLTTVNDLNEIVLDHDILNSANEKVYYKFTNLSENHDIYAISYYSQSKYNNVNFSGFVVKTNFDVTGHLHVEKIDSKYAFVNKFSQLANIVYPGEKKYKLDDDGIRFIGDFNSELKSIMKKIQDLNFNNITFIDQNFKLAILVRIYPLIPKFKKFNNKEYRDQEKLIESLISLSEYISSI